MMQSRLSRLAGSMFFLVFFLLTPVLNVSAEELPDAVQAKVDAALAKLGTWAADPAVVDAVKAANAAGDTGLNNGSWIELDANSPQVTAITSSALSQQLEAWKQAENLNKLYLRAKDGHLVAGPTKPLVYNISKRKPYQGTMKGAAWHGKQIKPDPTTQKRVVQIAVPVKDGAEVIGVLHSSVFAD